METTTINANDVKKDLYKSKVNAKFSHYNSGNLYYTVELADGIYQFPISTIDRVTLEETTKKQIFTEGEDGTKEYFNKMLLVDSDDSENIEELRFDRLSSDLGITDFSNEIKGSDLNRWIVKSIEKNEFIKIG